MEEMRAAPSGLALASGAGVRQRENRGAIDFATASSQKHTSAQSSLHLLSLLFLALSLSRSLCHFSSSSPNSALVVLFSFVCLSLVYSSLVTPPLQLLQGTFVISVPSVSLLICSAHLSSATHPYSFCSHSRANIRTLMPPLPTSSPLLRQLESLCSYLLCKSNNQIPLFQISHSLLLPTLVQYTDTYFHYIYIYIYIYLYK